ncbi:nuclease-related domain-containing protein [Virgibacillus ndiopensis]|uniref:nuclease-related domain-containing protein n=1 Tax=Virgibacillus ndiopensis TaxID=2004408 RepID=UPI000C06B7F7|nr:nuclease-related domain-containing protein [Virgibacillus ndiopensis]
MLYKSRTKSNELKILELLNNRMKLDNKDKQHLLNLKKGYEGEVIFDSLTEQLQCECLILNDLLLEVNSTTFQIDSLFIVQGRIYFYEVKNFEGDYYYESNKLYKKPKFEIVNPLDQLSRSESLLRQLLFNLGFNLPIESLIVFINPNFTLYQAPLNKPILFLGQVKRHLNNLNTTPSKLTIKHKKIAEQLFLLHKSDSPYKQIPPYNYEQLRKGIICPKCQSLYQSVEKRKCICQYCGQAESVVDAVLRNTKEFKLLFPNEKITTNKIHDWCQVVQSKERIRKVLKSNFKIVGVHQWSHYE